MIDRELRSWWNSLGRSEQRDLIAELDLLYTGYFDLLSTEDYEKAYALYLRKQK